MERAFKDLFVLTWNFQDHDLGVLSDFPDSATFYKSNWQCAEDVASLVYLNTCNRAELYLETETAPDVGQLLSALPLPPDATEPVVKQGIAAATHLMSVAAGLKSMAIGETQITGQVKRDVARSQERNLISSRFHMLLQKTFETQKKIRSETRIGQNPVSLLSLMEREIMARRPEFSLLGETVALGGTGDMSTKVFSYLVSRGASKVIVLRHDTTAPIPAEFGRVRQAAEVECEFRTWRSLLTSSNEHWPLLVTSSQATAPLLTLEKLGRLRSNGTLTPTAPIVDLGQPANVEFIDPGEVQLTAADADEVAQVINLSALLKQSEANQKLRTEYMAESLPIIDKAVKEYWLSSVYRNNSSRMQETIEQIENERRDEWQRLLDGPLKQMGAKQRRIVQDYFRKQEKKSARMYEELFVDMIAEDKVGR